MFNNPFGSFQDSVAAAMEDREQLDRLLTISTPPARLLVAAIGVLSLLLAAWLFFGDVARNLTVDAVLVESGESQRTEGRAIHALAWIDRDFESQVRAGLPAVVRLAGAEGEVATIGAEIREVSAEPMTGRWAQFELSAPISVHHVKIVLDKDLDIEIRAGTIFEIAIDVGRHSPIALLRMR